MGFRFRKSINFGPFRINFSKSGIGYSFGGKGFRVTKTATGKTLREALDKAYKLCDSTKFKGAHFRRDIAHRQLAR